MNNSFTQGLNTNIGAVNTLSGAARYQADPLAVYQKLCGERENSLLLESAEIDKKHQLKSLLLTDAAVKIVCHGNQVSFTPLSLNGEAAVAFARSVLEKNALLEQEGTTLIATFAAIAKAQDEKSRLMAVNPFQGLRLFNQIENKDNHPFAIFLHLYSEMEMAKSLILKSLMALDADVPEAQELTHAAKAKIGQVAQLAAQEGVQWHGGVGMTDAVDIGFFMKRVRVAEAYLGDSNYHANEFARLRGY